MKCKKSIDARGYDHKTLEAIRMSAVQRVETGESPEDLARGYGINRRTIYRWIEAYHYGGLNALKAKAIPGAPSKLTARQMENLAKLIREKNPQQMRLGFALWTLALIRQVVKDKFNVSLSEVSVGRLMKRLGFTPQRPLYRAWQQDPGRVEHWKKTAYPELVKRAKRENALIFFADESGLRSDYHAGTTWAEQGRTPIVKATGKRYAWNMLSAVNALGHFRFMVVEGSVTAKVFYEFLQRLVMGMEKKVFLVVDGHPCHKAKLVKAFIGANTAKIELFFLPPYSPELNPDELVWGHVKARVAKQVATTKEEMKAKLLSALYRLQKLPEIISNFFKTPSCAYTVV
jgi:transposase